VCLRRKRFTCKSGLNRCHVGQGSANFVVARAKPIPGGSMARATSTTKSEIKRGEEITASTQEQGAVFHDAPEYSARHYSPEEVAEMWNLSCETVRRLFQDVPGVLVIGSSISQRGKRRYRTMRIPESALLRVHRELARP
jgi:hypothetical protein